MIICPQAIYGIYYSEWTDLFFSPLPVQLLFIQLMLEIKWKHWISNESVSALRLKLIWEEEQEDRCAVWETKVCMWQKDIR